MSNTTKLAAAAALAAFALASLDATAGITTVDISAGSQWRSTDDALLGQQWAIGNFQPTDGFAATAPYGNLATALNSNRMMWACGATGADCPGGGDGGRGPTEVFFGYSFDIAAGSAFSGGVAIIADDFFDLVVNGQEVLAATLDGHQDPLTGQPVPLIVDLTPFLRTGTNVLALRAMDGYLESAAACSLRGTGWVSVSSNLGDFCKGDRANEYLFMSGSVTMVPAPGALMLAATALLALVATSRGHRPGRG